MEINKEIDNKNETEKSQKIEIEKEQYEHFLTENASLKKELEMLKKQNVDENVITIDSTKKPEPVKNEQEKKKGILI